MRKRVRSYNAPDLHCHSTFSLLDGFGSPESVVKRAVELGWGAAALTEHGWMGSAPAFYEACRAHKINPILGCEMYVVPDDAFGIRDKSVRTASKHLTVLALSKEGYHNLVAWNTLSMQGENFYHKPRISIEAMVESAPWPLHHNVILSGCMGGELCGMLAELNGSAISAGTKWVDAMKSVWPNFYIELQHHRHEKFIGKEFERYEEMVARQDLVRAQLLEIAARTGTSTVLTNDSHYQDSGQRRAHIAMLGSKLNRWAKDEATDQTLDPVKGYIYWRNYMQSMEALEERTPGAEGSCATTLEIVGEADIRLDPLDRFSYAIPDSGYGDKMSEIRDRSRPRLKRLTRKHGRLVVERFEHELKAMGDFADYLLMMSDFITNAHRQGILTNTRGSAANSLVCYCLGIHEIDPIEYKLTFERFVNPERAKLPDIDIDIQYDRYQDFMQYVKEYVSEREGDDNIALLCNYGMLANRSTFRMVAESLGVPQDVQDDVAQLLPQMIDSGLVDEGEDVYTLLKETYPEIYELASDVFDNMKNVSQHACGWIFGTKDRPLNDWVPRYWIASSGQLVTQFDYHWALKFGLNKGDFLRLKMLKVVADTLKSIGRSPMDFYGLPLDDEKTFEMIRAGKTQGIFTLQGKTNRQGVIEVEPQDEHGVIASVAIYRPSLTRPGYHHVYNARRKGEETARFESAAAEMVLGETYGLPIFQEQILDLGYAIGFDHVEAQELLDAIKLAKGVGRGAAEAFERIRPLFIKRATEGGLSLDAAEATWELVGSFKGYGFNRGHASSYGRFAVRAAYLKCHHPQDYFVALLDTYPEKHKYVADARGEGYRLIPPDANLSVAGYNKGTDEHSIRVGLSAVEGVGPVAVKAVMAGQPFSSLDDLKERTPSTAVKVTTINNLAAVGAFADFGIRPTDDDTEMLKLLGFLLDMPKAMEGLPKPKFTRARSDNGWKHLGYQAGVEFTEPRASVSKRFWIPEIELNDKKTKLFQKKATAWARVNTHLLLVVDENGIPFHVTANEDKRELVDYLDFMARKHRGSVICLDGWIKQPFEADGPMVFRLSDVTGAFNSEPQVWGCADENMVKAFSVLHKRKRRARAAA